jgi:hypothetical protein
VQKSLELLFCLLILIYRCFHSDLKEGVDQKKTFEELWRKMLVRFTQSKENLREEAYNLLEAGTGPQVRFKKIGLLFFTTN